MKQNITVKQLNELSDGGKARLMKWWKPKVGDKIGVHDGYKIEDGHNWMISFIGEENTDGYWDEIQNAKEFNPLLSIGQMIEFLETDDFAINRAKNGWIVGRRNSDGSIQGMVDPSELVDALWEAVKEILNET